MGKYLILALVLGFKQLPLQRKKTSVLAVDVQKSVIDFCKTKHPHKKITWLQSNLFANMKKERTKKFDTIIFNPPYLPQDVGITDRRLYGGKKGVWTDRKSI